jgi:hypothetical protein
MEAAFASRPAVLFDDRVVTHAEFLDESARWANLFLAQPPSTPDGVLHVAAHDRCFFGFAVLLRELFLEVFGFRDLRLAHRLGEPEGDDAREEPDEHAAHEIGARHQWRGVSGRGRR